MTDYTAIKKNVKVIICDIKSQYCRENCYHDPLLPLMDEQQNNYAVKEEEEYKIEDEEISDYEDEDEKDSSNDDEDEKISGYKDEDEEDSNDETAGLSSYEKMIAKKRKEKMSFLKSICIDEAKAGLCAAVRSTKRPPPKKQIKVPNENPRRSIRPRNTVDFSEKTLFRNVFKKTTEKLRISPEKKQWSKRLEKEVPLPKEVLNTKVNAVRNSLPKRSSKRKYVNLSEEALSEKVMEGIEEDKAEKDPDYEDKAEKDPEYEDKAEKDPEHEDKAEEDLDYENMPFQISFKEALEREKSYEDYIKDVTFQESKSEPKFHSYDLSTFKNLSLKESVTRISAVRIYTLSWYPSMENSIVAAGDTRGNIVIWNLDSDSDSYMFNVHFKLVSHLQFNPFNPVRLFSSSPDGTLCCGDMVKHMFTQIYNASNSSYASCTYFDFLSSEEYLMAFKNGEVAIVDQRTDKSARHLCGGHLNTVSVHPVTKNYFITAGSVQRAVRLWDLRNMKAKPVDEIKEQTIVLSAFFSPVTGNSILSNSENSICIFDSMNLSEHMKLRKKMQYRIDCKDYPRGKAIWLPHSEESFVRSYCHPYRIEVYDKDCNIYYTLKQNQYSYSYNAHPFRPSLATGHHDGKLSIFG